MRKMHVPAYWAVVDGVQEGEKRGVCVDVKRVPAMGDVDIVPPVAMGSAEGAGDEDMALWSMGKF